MAVQPTPLSETSSTAELQRYHAFDSLRAAMMLLGLVLHGVRATVIGQVLNGQRRPRTLPHI